MKIERKWKYGHNMPHTLNIFFCRDLKKVHFIFQTPLTVKIEKWGGISPPWLKSFKNGGEITPRGDITPLSFLSNLRRGGYHHLFRKLCKMGGISHLGGISPPCPYMASVNGWTATRSWRSLYSKSISSVPWNCPIKLTFPLPAVQLPPKRWHWSLLPPALPGSSSLSNQFPGSHPPQLG